MRIEVDNWNNEDKNLPDEITQEDLDELFNDIATQDIISWNFERKLRKRNIL